MAPLWGKANGHGEQGYIALSSSEKERPPRKDGRRRGDRHRRSSLTIVYVVSAMLFLYVLSHLLAASTTKHCDTVDEGYACSLSISHHWGQYSMWYAVPSEVDVTPPRGCEVTFANVLSRHGARDPTTIMSAIYGTLINKVQGILNGSTNYPIAFDFLKDYKYTLGAESLTDAGRQEMVNSGAHFLGRYPKLAQNHDIFVRATDQDRVLESAQRWLDGFAQEQDQKLEVDVIISESSPNNTLSPARCLSYDSASNDDVLPESSLDILAPIRERINSVLHSSIKLNLNEIVYLMDICPFDTVAHPSAKVSSFCGLFSEMEWHQYDYYKTLAKFYGYGPGKQYGPTMGVGYVNELIARLTEKPVQDDTTTNRTLDSDPRTFPLDRKLYADFSHDNDMSSILAALGVYNMTGMLPRTSVVEPEDAYGYSAAWTVPFAARIYVEKLQCDRHAEEFVRVVVNDRVQPLEFCGGDKHGRCTLSNFVKSQSFARGGGLWEQCGAPHQIR